MLPLILSLAGLLVSEAPAPASRQALLKLLPPGSAVKNWNVFSGTRSYAPSADKLSLIYDGGDKPYIDAGCVEALQQSYRNPTDKHIATLTVHRMKSGGKAKALYESERKGVAGKPGFKQLTGLKTAGYLFASPGTSSTYGYRDRYYVTVVVAGATTADHVAASRLLRYVLARIKPATHR